MSTPTDRPNILVFFSDQQRWDTVGCYPDSGSLDITPNLDHLAGEGVRFERAFTCQPVCGPARACLQTGKCATETGCFKNHIALGPDEKTLAHFLGDAGYETAYIGKWHLASEGKVHDYRRCAVPVERRGGYRDFWLAADTLEHTSHSYDGHMWDIDGNRREFPEGRYRADVLGDWAIEYLENRSSDRPFFLFISFIEPHHQNDNNRYEGPTGSKERFADYPVPGDLVDTDGDWRENYPDYLGCVNALDANLGRIRDALERLGQADNTLIVYTSDHGSHFRTRNSEYKRSCHDSCTRIPMVVSGPGFAGGRVVDELVSLLDVPPTIVSAAGLEIPRTMRRRPLQELAGNSTPADWPDDVFLQISEDHVGRAVRTDEWTYELLVPREELAGGAAPGAIEYWEGYLYHNPSDPHQRNNLVADPAYADARAALARRLKDHMVAIGEPEPTIHPARS